MKILIEGVSKSFSSESATYPEAILMDLDFSIRHAGLYCITGRSGIGKTTLFNMISGLILPDSGSVTVAPASVSYCFQEHLLLPWLTVRQNLSLAVLSTQTSQKESDIRISEVLSVFKMSEFDIAFPPELSGGQQQRVAIMRSLLPRHRIVLMDEPYAHLDQENRRLLTDILTEYVRTHNAIVLISSHHVLENSRKFSDIFAFKTVGRQSRLVPV